MKSQNLAILLFLFTYLFTYQNIAQAIEKENIPLKKQTIYNLYLSPEQVFELKETQGDQVLFIDVRSRPEIKYIGAPALMDANIPIRYINTEFLWSEKSSTYRTLVNDHFAADVEKLLTKTGHTKSTPVILICQTGSRVPAAAKQLYQAGFEKVYSSVGGFEGSKAKSGQSKGKRVVNGWKNANMPWSYKLDKSTMYFNFDASK